MERIDREGTPRAARFLSARIGITSGEGPSGEGFTRYLKLAAPCLGTVQRHIGRTAAGQRIGWHTGIEHRDIVLLHMKSSQRNKEALVEELGLDPRFVVGAHGGVEPAIVLFARAERESEE